MMHEVNMELINEIPRFGIPSASKPICTGYTWASWFINLTDQVALYIRLVLEDYGKLVPRYLQLEVSFIPHDKYWLKKISQACHIPSSDPESLQLGISHIYNLGLLRQNKGFGIIGFEKGEYAFSVSYSDHSLIKDFWEEFNVSGLVVEDFILSQLNFIVGEDVRLKKNLALALKRLAKMISR